MRELFGRLTAVDPAAGDALAVIDYFDRLVNAQAGAGSLLREAAILSRSTIGFVGRDRSRCFLASGAEEAATDRPTGALVAAVEGSGEVWLLPGETSVPTAAMVLDRLAVALAITEKRVVVDGASRSAVEVLVADPLPSEPETARIAALGRLRLEATGTFRVVALRLSTAPPVGSPHALVDTRWGPTRAVIVRAAVAWTLPGGVGTAANGLLLHRSWRHALIALRLGGREGPFSAEALRALLPVLDAAGEDDLSRDEVGAVQVALDHRWSTDQLQAVADGLSLRGIAAVAGLHHSTVQDRIDRLPALLGYDPQTSLGRTRLNIALMLHELTTPTASERPLPGH